MIISICLILLGFGCKKESYQNEQTSLSGTKWILSYIQDTRTNGIIYYPNDESKKISIAFTDSLNVLLFSGVCNGGQGIYSYSSVTDSFKVYYLGTTLIYCKYVEWEEYVTYNLQNAFRFAVNDNQLAIFSKGTYNLYFSRN